MTKIEGVFSGTLSYIFNEFSTGSADGPAFSTVVRTARDNGYTVCHFPSSHRRDRGLDRRWPSLFPLCPSDVFLPLSSHLPPSFGVTGFFLGTTPSRRSKRRGRRAQADHSCASPLRNRPAATGDLTARRLCFRAHAVPDPRDALSLVCAHR